MQKFIALANRVPHSRCFIVALTITQSVMFLTIQTETQFDLTVRYLLKPMIMGIGQRETLFLGEAKSQSHNLQSTNFEAILHLNIRSRIASRMSKSSFTFCNQF